MWYFIGCDKLVHQRLILKRLFLYISDLNKFETDSLWRLWRREITFRTGWKCIRENHLKCNEGSNRIESNRIKKNLIKKKQQEYYKDYGIQCMFGSESAITRLPTSIFISFSNPIFVTAIMVAISAMQALSRCGVNIRGQISTWIIVVSKQLMVHQQ